MIETRVKDYLDSLGLGKAYMERPSKPEYPFFLIEKTGGGMTDHVWSATIVVQSYGKSLFEAASINEIMKKEMLSNLPFKPLIGSVGLNTDYNFTDNETQEYRYQAVFEITYMEV